jgi:hypothetical protein
LRSQTTLRQVGVGWAETIEIEIHFSNIKNECNFSVSRSENLPLTLKYIYSETVKEKMFIWFCVQLHVWTNYLSNLL